MPEYKVWIKIGGDHGGSSFKLCLKVCNMEKPNSTENTFAFCCISAQDLYPNLESLTSLYADKIFKLQHNEI